MYVCTTSVFTPPRLRESSEEKICSACTLMAGVTSKRGLGCEGPLEGWRGGGAPENGEAVIGGIS